MKKKARFIVLIFVILSVSCVISAQSWDQVIRLVSSDRTANDVFGWSVAISGDYAIVGAYYDSEDASGANTLVGAGSAYFLKIIPVYGHRFKRLSHPIEQQMIILDTRLQFQEIMQS